MNTIIFGITARFIISMSISRRDKIIVVGAGLAGFSCAVELAEKGYKVTILEANEYIGGRTASWNDNGMEVESGLHRFLGFYTHLPKLLNKCGVQVDDIIDWLNEIDIVLPENGPRATFAISPTDKPLESIGDLLGNTDFLPLSDKLALGKFLAAGIKDYSAEPDKLDTFTVLEYAKKHKLSDTLIKRVLVPFTEGIFFLPPEKYSAFVLFSLVVPYLPVIYKVGEGAFKGGMTKVMMDPIANYLIQVGGEVRTNSKVDSLIIENNKVSGVICNGQNIECSHVVVATELGAAQSIIKNTFNSKVVDHFDNLMKLKSMPAVTVQFELNKPALPTDKVQFSPDTYLASYAEQSRTTFKDTHGRLSIILGKPEKFINLKPENILEIILKETKRVGIDISDYKDYRVVSHPYDFYSLTPQSEKLRPTQKTNLHGLTLAGDYTKQKYIATMEGAVYSGQLACEAAISSLTND